MEDCTAWMVPLRGDHRAAVGELELVHVLPDPPELFTVLKAPAHCRRVFLWEGHVLPVFDLSHWLGDAPEGEENTHIGVFRYRPQTGSSAAQALRYGSLVIQGAPRQVRVNDSQACELPPDRQAWRPICDACFEYAGQAIPVLNLPRIFDHAL